MFKHLHIQGATITNGVYLQDLEVCFVDIHQHCARFSDQSFSGFTAVSQSIVGFCDLFSRRVNGEGSLREQIAILTDETVEKSSSAYAEALEKSHIIAMELSESTRELKDQCDKLVKRLHAVSLILLEAGPHSLFCTA